MSTVYQLTLAYLESLTSVEGLSGLTGLQTLTLYRLDGFLRWLPN